MQTTFIESLIYPLLEETYHSSEYRGSPTGLSIAFLEETWVPYKEKQNGNIFNGSYIRRMLSICVLDIEGLQQVACATMALSKSSIRQPFNTFSINRRSSIGLPEICKRSHIF